MFGSCFGGYCFLLVPRGTFSFSLHLWKHALRRELSFKKGDAVNIIRQIDNNWYEGEFRGRVGIFPMSYVEVSAHVCPTTTTTTSTAECVCLTSSPHKQKMPSSEKQQPIRPPPPAQVREIGEAVARYNFNADTNVELSLRKVVGAEKSVV